MFTLILGFVIGAFVGWSVPQPAWAAAFVAKLKAKFAKK
jgi:hypothetical protein